MRYGYDVTSNSRARAAYEAVMRRLGIRPSAPTNRRQGVKRQMNNAAANQSSTKRQRNNARNNVAANRSSTKRRRNNAGNNASPNRPNSCGAKKPRMLLLLAKLKRARPNTPRPNNNDKWRRLW